MTLAILATETVTAATLMALHRATGEALGVLRARIADREPIAIVDVDLNDRDDARAMVAALLDALGDAAEVHELAPHEAWASSPREHTLVDAAFARRLIGSGPEAHA